MTRVVAAFFIALTTGPAFAGADPSSLAAELVKLRGEVEALSEELELERARAREEIAGLAQRKSELDADRQREELRLRRVEAALAELRSDELAASRAEASLLPAVEEAAALLRAHVQASLPFRTAERSAAVDDIEAALATGELSPRKAALRLWSLGQDELRLTRESGLYRQTLRLGEETFLAEVARIGMVMLFFQAPDGSFGRAVHDGSAWRFERLEGEGERRQVEHLFLSFKKQLRAGYFELPAALPPTLPREVQP